MYKIGAWVSVSIINSKSDGRRQNIYGEETKYYVKADCLVG